MIARIFNNASLTIASAAFFVLISSLASRLLGLWRDRLLASQFGAGEILDAYFAAFRLPDLVYNFLVFGALSAGFIPLLVSYIEKKKIKQLQTFYVSVFHLIILIVGAASLVMAFAAPFLVKFIAPGFSPETQEITIQLTRIMSLSPFLLGISSVISGALQAVKRFVWYALAPVMYNVGIIVGILFFVEPFGPVGLAYGVVLGALLHVLVQLPGLKGTPFRYTLNLSISKGIKKLVAMMGPRILTLALSQFHIVLLTILASTLAIGSVSMFQLAFNLQSVVVGLFGISFAVAAFPTLCSYWEKKDTDGFLNTLSHTIRQILFFVIPSTVILIVLRAQIVRLVFGTGAFDWEDTVMTANALGIFAVSLFAQCLIPLLVRAYYTLHDTKTPFYMGLSATVVFVACAWYCMQTYGFLGLMLSFTVMNLVYFMALFIGLHHRLGEMQEGALFVSTFKFFFAAMFMGVGMQATKYLIAPFVDMQTVLGVLAQTSSALLVGAIIYVISSMWQRSEEMKTFLEAIYCRLRCVKDVPRVLFPSE